MTSISFPCPSCGKTIKASQKDTGRKGRCRCGVEVTVPRESPEPDHALDQRHTPTARFNAVGTQDAIKTVDTLGRSDEFFDGSFDAEDKGEVAGDILAVLSEIRDSLRSSNLQPAPPQTNRAQKEYKVLSQKDSWFSQKFDPKSLEDGLNAYAEQGWSVKAITTATIPGFGGNRDEMVVVLER